jgi:hydrogenase maturation protease
MQSPRILIAGIGNIFLGDDGFGCAVIDRLLQRELPGGVRITDFGIRGLDLAYALLDGYDVTILVDSVSRGGSPGTLYIIEPDLNAPTEQHTNGMMVEAHTMNPMRALCLAKSMHSLGDDLGDGLTNEAGEGMRSGALKKILLVGCEPETLGPEEGHLGLSQPALVAVDEAVKIVESLLADILGNQLSSKAVANAF